MKQLVHIWIILLPGLSIQAQDLSAYQKNIFTDHGVELPYRILSPQIDTVKKYPLLIFLHGAFEKGNDNEMQLNIGGRFFMRDSIQKNYPAYILFPQCPSDDSWAYFENHIDFTTGFAVDWNFPFKKEPTSITGILKKLIDHLLTVSKIETSQIYIVGLSQGGMGVLDMIARYPNLFAAGLSICGAGEPSTTKYFAGKTALWLFHGEKDQVVPPTFSREFYKRLKKVNAVTRYIEYKGVEHNSWVNAFKEPELMSWLFAQKKQ